MIHFEVESYWLSARMGLGQPFRVYMMDSDRTYRGYIAFLEEHTGAQPYIVHPNGIINAYMPFSRLQPVLDMLRLEKPVYFTVNEDTGSSWISTLAEPTGEEEGGGA